MSVLKWGILGSGKIANDFTMALTKCAAASVVAVAARSKASADAFAKTHGM